MITIIIINQNERCIAEINRRAFSCPSALDLNRLINYSCRAQTLHLRDADGVWREHGSPATVLGRRDHSDGANGRDTDHIGVRRKGQRTRHTRPPSAALRCLAKEHPRHPSVGGAGRGRECRRRLWLQCSALGIWTRVSGGIFYFISILLLPHPNNISLFANIIVFVYRSQRSSWKRAPKWTFERILANSSQEPHWPMSHCDWRWGTNISWVQIAFEIKSLTSIEKRTANNN